MKGSTILGVAVLVAASALRAQEPTGLEVSAVRFSRAAGGQTLVDVFCRIPLGSLTRVSATGGAAYRIAVSVRDSTNLQLVTQAWSQAVPAAALRLRRASTSEHFAFAARPGRYTVDVSVADSGSGKVSRQQLDVSAFAARPLASDLLLASSLRQAGGPADSVPRGAEIRKGALFLATSGQPMLTPERSQLGYYLELYPQRAETATVTLRVKGAAGNQIVATVPQQVALGVEGGVTRGVVDLGGLPPGAYRLEADVATPDSAVVRAAPFGMAGFETAAALAPPPDRTGDVFGGLSELQLDSLYGPLVYLMSAEEQGIYSTLTVEGKRAFLRKFWAGRDPTPGTPENEAFDRFYTLIGEANRRYREGGAAEIPGWRTDRGRIYVRYGPPDEVLERPVAGSTKPYEVWKYTHVRNRKFIFMDLTQFGHYTLIWTDERREPTLPNWHVLLGDAVEDAFRF